MLMIDNLLSYRMVNCPLLQDIDNSLWLENDN